MPRLSVSKDEEMNRALRGSIKYAQEVKGMDGLKLSKLTGIPKSTLYHKLKNPDRFTVRELRMVFKVLGYREDDKEKFARESI